MGMVSAGCQSSAVRSTTLALHPGPPNLHPTAPRESRPSTDSSRVDRALFGIVDSSSLVASRSCEGRVTDRHRQLHHKSRSWPVLVLSWLVLQNLHNLHFHPSAGCTSCAPAHGRKKVSSFVLSPASAATGQDGQKGLHIFKASVPPPETQSLSLSFCLLYEYYLRRCLGRECRVSFPLLPSSSDRSNKRHVVQPLGYATTVCQAHSHRASARTALASLSDPAATRVHCLLSWPL